MSCGGGPASGTRLTRRGKEFLARYWRFRQGVDAIINVPCLADHRLLGVACGVENITLPLVRRPGRLLDGQVHQAVVGGEQPPDQAQGDHHGGGRGGGEHQEHDDGLDKHGL